ncbi:BNR-4 repeat-containing protein [Roseibacillus ishigakijimensis]|uniref:BNR-4 repeat-containing protein n=1 Tax=Roseibacillus ishigakijimensis TaxID=454146 RepID=A0A934RS02_9BACT|nr:BNR-4 repeat-containing protein [Roseibacillus ishigakijimensis]MBK1833949.1 BNR-4 repeat-containing protein [Roseibacillus ishigakijimensis]
MKTLATFLAATPLALAAPLAHYGLNNNAFPDSVAVGVSASDITFSATTATGYSSLEPIEGSHYRYLKNTQMVNDVAPSPEHIQARWSLTPQNGESLNLASIGGVTWSLKAYDQAPGNDGIVVQAVLYVATDEAFNDIVAQSNQLTISANADSGSSFGEVVAGRVDGLVSSAGPLYFGLALTDNSGLSDKDIRFDDITVHGTVGTAATDSDGDGLSDAEESSGALNPAFGNATTNANEADSDGDGDSDFYELAAVPPTDPNDATSFSGRISFVNASLDKLTLADGSPLSENSHYLNYSGGTVPGGDSVDDKWNIRRTWANGGEIIASGDAGPEDAPTLALTLDGLASGQLYQIYSYFWAADASTQAWDVRTGLSAGQLGLSNPSQNARDLSGFDAQPGEHFLSDSVDCQEGNRELYETFLGYREADENGEIVVYLDDTPETGHRTWFDGAGFVPSYLDLTPGVDDDGDGLDNVSEVRTHGTDPALADSDGDGLQDGAEINLHQTDPLLADSDQDGFADATEINRGSDPLDAASTPYAVVASDGVWTWFNDERAIWHLGKLYTGYVLSDGQYGISQYDPATKTRRETIISTAASRETDDHNNPSITILPDDTLLILYAKHSTESRFYWRRSTVTEPASIDDWSAESSKDVSAAYTYNNTYRLTAESNRIYNFHREIGWDPTLMYSDDNGATWSDTHLVIDSGGNGRRPYPKYWSNGEDRIDFIYTDGHPDETNTSIYHLYYESGDSIGTGAFKQSDGTALKTLGEIFAGDAIDHDGDQAGTSGIERGSVVYGYQPAGTSYGVGEDQNDFLPGGRAWTWDICYQENGHPVCAFQVQQNNGNYLNDRIQYYYAVWNGSQWRKKLIAQGGRPIYNSQRYYGGGMAIDPEHPNVVYISSNHSDPTDLDLGNTTLNEEDRYEIYRGITTDGGETFTWEAITSDSAQDHLRPIVPANHGYDHHVVWFHGRYSSYVNYDTNVLALIENEESGAILIDGCGFDEAGHFYLDVRDGVAHRRVTSADNLDFTNASAVNTTDDGLNRFLIPSSERHPRRDFFRVESTVR